MADTMLAVAASAPANGRIGIGSNDRRRIPRPGLARAWWIREALADEAAGDTASEPGRAADTRSRPAPAEQRADVVIVGGGYTGMWAAYHLTERDPGMRIVLIEQDICGGGPSGRNGGFLHGWWDQLPALESRYGGDAALSLAIEVDRSVELIGEWCRRHGVDAWYRRSGYLQVSAAPAQDGHWNAAVDACRRLGVADEYVPLNRAEVRARCDSPVFRGGVFMRSAATVQPARLARGLRRVLLGRGVEIRERQGVRRLELRGGDVVASTLAGRVIAQQAIVAVNAWAAGWRWYGSQLLAWGSYIALTEPAPERLAQMRWTGGEGIADSRFALHYFRTTPDGRVAFGAGVGQAGFGGRIGASFTRDVDAVRRAATALRRLLPAVADVPLAEAWGGPIDVSLERLPVIGSRAGGRIHHAHGFSGNGVGPAEFAGRVLAARIAAPGDRLARLPIVNAPVRRLPPEPIRFVGARLVREALVRLDESHDAGHAAPLPVRALAGLPRRLGYPLGPEPDRIGWRPPPSPDIG